MAVPGTKLEVPPANLEKALNAYLEGPADRPFSFVSLTQLTAETHDSNVGKGTQGARSDYPQRLDSKE